MKAITDATRQHGTHAGYQQHVRARDLPACAGCKTAAAAYIREFRTGRVNRARHDARTKARVAALKALAAAHPTEYRALYVADRDARLGDTKNERRAS